MKYGYARVSTPDQCLNLQLDALRLYGVDHICEEKISGKNKNKPVLDALIAKLKTGDQLIVWETRPIRKKNLRTYKTSRSS
jgi:DNA invertase Pin-like site-specific DNA recombinase